jgi:lysophospholipase L1-like esterase
MALKSRSFRMSAVALGTAAVAATALVATTGTTLAATASVKPVVSGTPYLALGDSIVFGFREQANMPSPDYQNAASFVGYPEDIAAAMGLRLTNASCPGETTSSMINKHAASNGCENTYNASTGQQDPVGYRTAYPLHVSYSGSQLAFAKKFLKLHPKTRLVTLTIGANDAFLCQAKTSDGCIGEFGALSATLKKNLGTIFAGIRGTGYTGQIALLNYYSLDYSDNTQTGEVQILDNALAQGAKGYHVRIASAFDSFKAATDQNGGDTCQAELITVLQNQSSPCGVHPSVQGQALLAQTVMAKVKK